MRSDCPLCANRDQVRSNMIGAKRKTTSAVVFPNVNLIGAEAIDKLSQSLELEHIDAGQRNLVND